MHSSDKMDTFPALGVCLHRLLVVLSCVLCQIDNGRCFNVDIDIPEVHTGRSGTMFGFSVAQHIDQEGSWLLVGAPKASTTQPNLIQPGGVYKCPVASSNNCPLLEFDSFGNKNQWNGTHMVTIEQKSHQWFGATLASSGRDGAVVACAPRYVFFTRKSNRREPIGQCFVAESSNSYQSPLDYSPCGHDLDKEYGYVGGKLNCQNGMSAALNSQGDNLVMGAVGSYYWQGQAFSQNLLDESIYYETGEHQKQYDDGYMGYAAAVGEFTGDSIDDYVIGIPKGEGLKGQVGFFTKELNRFYNLSGEQEGEYFGTSIAVGDFNGDGLDDVAVGAPFYCDYSSDAYDMGRVYVNYQTKDPMRRFTWERTRLVGHTKSRARFGMAVAAISDINNDGPQDLAVGAPYGGADGRGEVYIFQGSSRGLVQRPSQVVSAQDISPALRTFGYSLSGGYDMDGNLYPDILVGAYESSHAVLLKSRPIIRVQTELKVEPHVITLERKNCTLSNGKAVSCFAVVSCLSYGGLKVPMEIALDLEWRLDSLKNLTKRAFYIGDTERESTLTGKMRLRKATKRCTTAMVYIKDNIRDKLKPINIEMKYSLREVRPPPGELAPLLDVDIPNTVSSQAVIQRRCGADDVCIPDLAVFGQSIGHYVLGTASDVDIRIHVVNQGEDAYEAQVKVVLPPDVPYRRIHSVNSKYSVVCNANSATVDPGVIDSDELNIVTCDLGNPLPSNQEVIFMMTVEGKNVDGKSEHIKFRLTANSTNPENTTTWENNDYDVYLPVRAIVSITVSGISEPEHVLYNATIVDEFVTEGDIGPELIHLYEVHNFGPSSIKTLSTIIHWPSYLEGGHFLYLPEVPRVVRGQGVCVMEDPSALNPENVTIERSSKTDYKASKLKGSRRKRDISASTFTGTFTTTSEYEDRLLKVECTDKEEADCRRIRCETGLMARDVSVLIEVRARVWMNTGIKLQDEYRGVQVYSQAVSHVLAVPYKVKPVEYAVDTFQIKTFVAALDSGPGTQRIHIWVLALAIIGGCILLLLLILLLWRCGFFIRKKAPEEKELLHRVKKEKADKNGHQNGKNSYYEEVPSDEF